MTCLQSHFDFREIEQRNEQQEKQENQLVKVVLAVVARLGSGCSGNDSGERSFFDSTLIEDLFPSDVPPSLTRTKFNRYASKSG